MLPGIYSPFKLGSFLFEHFFSEGDLVIYDLLNYYTNTHTHLLFLFLPLHRSIINFCHLQWL